MPSEVTAAFLWAQMEEAENITHRRMALWDIYHSELAALEINGRIRRPIIPSECMHNAHMYYLLLPDYELRAYLISNLKKQGINTVFHYIPLHTSQAGVQYSKTYGEQSVTNNIAGRLVRLPLWCGLEDHQKRVIDAVIRELT